MQLALLVSMVTSARRGVNVNFQTWIKNVISDMESATVNPDSPVNTVIKVCLITIKSYLTNKVTFLLLKGAFHDSTQVITSAHCFSLFLNQSKVS